jgi:hypothetical protein
MFNNILQMQCAASLGNRPVSTTRGEFTLQCLWLGNMRGHRWTLTRGDRVRVISECDAAQFLFDHRPARAPI